MQQFDHGKYFNQLRNYRGFKPILYEHALGHNWTIIQKLSQLYQMQYHFSSGKSSGRLIRFPTKFLNYNFYVITDRPSFALVYLNMRLPMHIHDIIKGMTKKAFFLPAVNSKLVMERILKFIIVRQSFVCQPTKHYSFYFSDFLSGF